MSLINNILSDATAGISQFKSNPMATIKEADGDVIAILNRNKPAFYAVPPELYEIMIEQLEDIELLEMARLAANGETVEVSLDDL